MKKIKDFMLNLGQVIERIDLIVLLNVIVISIAFMNLFNNIFIKLLFMFLGAISIFIFNRNYKIILYDLERFKNYKYLFDTQIINQRSCSHYIDEKYLNSRFIKEFSSKINYCPFCGGTVRRDYK